MRVEAVEGAYSITDENGNQELVSKVEYSTGTGDEAHSGQVSSMQGDQVITLCRDEWHWHSDGSLHCTGCSFC